MGSFRKDQINEIFHFRMRIGPRFRNRPVYGRVVHKPPSFRVQDVVERNRAFEEVAKMYGTINRGVESPRRRVTAFRLGGGGGLHGPVTITPQSGSFQHLKVSHLNNLNICLFMHTMLGMDFKMNLRLLYRMVANVGTEVKFLLNCLFSTIFLFS